MVERILQERAWRRIRIKIAARGDFLRNADSLEVHPKDGRDRLIFCATMVFAVNLVKDGLYLQVIICLCSADGARHRCNLWRIQICDTLTGWPIHDVIREVLVGPGGVQSSLPCDLKNAVHTEEAMRIDRCTALTAIER